MDACRLAGLELDVAGAGVDRIVTQPEQMLGQYDIVFAKAKAAMEAMAVGTAVVLCDFGGIGPMVTSARFDELRPLNFGFEALRDPLRVEHILGEIACYDPEDAAQVRGLLRSCAGLAPAVETLVAIYREVMAEDRKDPSGATPRRREQRSILSMLFLQLYWRWSSISPRHRETLKRFPGVRILWQGVRRLLRQTRR